jgi:hypothetical protein
MWPEWPDIGFRHNCRGGDDSGMTSATNVVTVRNTSPNLMNNIDKNKHTELAWFMYSQLLQTLNHPISIQGVVNDERDLETKT